MKVRQVESDLSSTDTSSQGLEDTDDDTGTDSVGRMVEETVSSAAVQEDKSATILAQIRPRAGGIQVRVQWLAESGVKRTLLSEQDWLAF